MVDQPQNLFEEEVPSTTAAVETVTDPKADDGVPKGIQPEDLLGLITNEDGEQKYADLTTALQSIPNSQAHIAKLEAENREIRAEIAVLKEAEQKTAGAEELVEMVRKAQGTVETPQGNQPLSQEEIKAAVLHVINERDEMKTLGENLDGAVARMADHFGSVEAAKAAMVSKMTELGMSKEVMKQMAASTPQAFLKLMDVPATTLTVPGKVQPRVNTEVSPQKPKPEFKSVLGGASTKELVAEYAKYRPTED